MRRPGRLSLGYFHIMPWLSEMGRDNHLYAKPVLLAPGLSKEETHWPIPVSLTEDIQQENFWKIQVTKYGHKMLRHGYLEYGIRTNKDSQTMTHIKNHPFPDERSKIEKEAQDLGVLTFARERAGIQLTPEERLAWKEFSRTVRRSNQQQRSRDYSWKQRVLVLKIQKLLISRPTAKDRSAVDQQIYDTLTEAVSVHFQVVVGLRDMETCAGVIDSLKRRELLRWNLRTRHFISFIWNPSNMMFRQPEKDLLSYRHELWPYLDTKGPWNEREEVFQISREAQDLKSTAEDALIRCGRIAEKDECSEQAKAITTMITECCISRYHNSNPGTTFFRPAKIL